MKKVNAMWKYAFAAAVLCVCVSSAAAQDDDSPPSTAREYQSRAYRHEMARRYDQAIADLTKAIELDPQSRGAISRGVRSTQNTNRITARPLTI